MDSNMLKLTAKVDQYKASVRDAFHELSLDESFRIYEACDNNRIHELSDEEIAFVGELAVVAILVLGEEIRNSSEH